MDRRLEVWKQIVQMMPSCANCEHYKDEVCSKYNAKPPAVVIVQGCEQWENCIPF